MRIRIAALAVALMACTDAFSCTCVGPSPAKTVREVAVWYSKQQGIALIFEGKVVKQGLRSGFAGAPQTAMSMTGSGQFRVVDFDIRRTFRGEASGHISVLTGFGGGDCGYDFQTGRGYLVYASAGPDGTWFTSICSGTSAIEDAGAAIRLFNGETATSEDLLSPQQYYEKNLPERTGSVCGQVLKPDGTPLKGADVELWELRDDNLPSRSASDPNTATRVGHFCIEHAQPGRYLLSAESTDFDHNARYMGFYPGVQAREKARQLQIKPGFRLPDVKFTTIREPLFTIRIRVMTPDGTQLSYKNGCGVVVSSVYRDPLSYHISHGLEADGSYTFGYIPAGKYVISTYFQPDFDGREMKPFSEASKWVPARQEVQVGGDTEVVIHMEAAK